MPSGIYQGSLFLNHNRITILIFNVIQNYKINAVYHFPLCFIRMKAIKNPEKFRVNRLNNISKVIL